MLSQTVEYALRAIVYLATQPNQARRTTPTIAEATSTPSGYLAKVMQSLVKAGLVSSRRGLGGGYALARVPEDITVLDVINAVDPIPRINCCPLSCSGDDRTLCPLHRLLDEAMATAEEAFGRASMGDLLADAPDGSCHQLLPGPA